MTNNKYTRIRHLCSTAKFPRTFAARLGNIDPGLLSQLTARQIAAIIDGPMARSYGAGCATSTLSA